MQRAELLQLNKPLRILQVENFLQEEACSAEKFSTLPSFIRVVAQLLNGGQSLFGYLMEGDNSFGGGGTFSGNISLLI